MYLPLAEFDWNSLVSDDPTGVIVCALWLAIGLLVLAGFVAVQWRKVRIAQENAGLKRQMIEEGFTPDDIIRVIQADTPTRHVGRRPHTARHVAGPACCPDSAGG
jgi:hypothetical protein